MRISEVIIYLDSACRLPVRNESIKSFSGARHRFSEKVFRVFCLFLGGFSVKIYFVERE